MRKILLATTALVGFVTAGAAQAATAPLNVTVGGNIDFVAGAFHESRAAGATNSASGEFETVYSLAFGVTGKTANGVDFGGNLVLDNDQYTGTMGGLNGNSNTISVTTATVFLSGAYGKLQLGDSRGATDLTVTAPSVAGIRFIDFLDSSRFSKKFVLGVDAKDHSTNATYYTPKFGNNEYGKVQAAVTFTPRFGQFGSAVQLVGNSNVRDVIKGALAYTGNIKSVAVAASADIITGDITAAATSDRPFMSWGAGITGAYRDFTLGFNYTDLGHYGSTSIQNKSQQVYGAGLKYAFCCKLAVSFNWLGGKAYDNALSLGTAGAQKYVKDFNNYNFGAAYTWAPGLTTDVNAVLFSQTQDKTGAKDNDGYVLMISEKLAF